MAATTNPPTKPINPANSFLLCTLCKGLFVEPVINVKCGHTFCRKCLIGVVGAQTSTKCPVDDSTCDLQALVVNRAVQGQLNDLIIYCRHGLMWSDSDTDYIIDETGCQEKIKYGNREEHEDDCVYAFSSCPNNISICGRFRRKDIASHLVSCNQIPCLHHTKGCDFRGKSGDLGHHLTVCGFRGLLLPDTRMMEITEANEALKDEVSSLRGRVETLEDEKSTLQSQVEHCVSCIKQLQSNHTNLQEKLEKLAVLRRSPSNAEPRSRTPSGSFIVRSPSAGSQMSRLSLGMGARHETWVMPFQFKCIGTLRGHREGVWNLTVHKSTLFSGGGDKVIKVWELENLVNGCKKTLTGHTEKVQTMAVGERFLYSGGADLTIRVWDLETLETVKVIENAHTQCVAAMLCSEDYLFSSSYETIKVWDATSLDLVHTTPGLHHWVRCLAFNSTRDKLYSGSHNTIEIWDALGKFNLKGKISHTYGSVHAISVTKRFIIIGTYNQNTHMYDVNSQQYLHKLTGHVGTITAIVASPSGRFLFTSSTDSHVQVWNLDNQLPIMPLSRHEASVNTLVIHGDLLLSGSEDTEIKVFKHFKLLPGAMPDALPAT